MNFVAIDFETANPDLASICQVGAVTFRNGGVSDAWHTLINPEDYFSPINVCIHGIEESMVQDAPTFLEIFEHFKHILTGKIIVHHTHFDRVALNRVIEKYRLPEIDFKSLDSARVVRRSWPEFSWKGYGLENVASSLNIQFNPHVAVEDARAAGEILVKAIDKTGISIEDWLIRVNKPIDPSCTGKITRNGNPEGPLAGEVLAFTGALSMPRRQAADIAALAGCDVAASVTKRTTILVIGDQDIRKLVGHDKSSKHRKAEKLISKGQPIRIIGENDFLKVLEQ